jgi:NADH-quinone oxidoreductase subunit M
MNQAGFPLLSIVIFLPLAGAGGALLLGRHRTAAKVWTLAVALADLALAGLLWGLFDYGNGGMQLVDRFDWIAPLGISYSVGVDGISLWLLMLTAFLTPIALLVSWTGAGAWARSGDLRPSAEPNGDRSYAFLLLALETGALGVFSAVDLVLFFVFWEAMLIPAYLLIGRWGGERRAYAALKFIVYTMAGSALMLVAILALAMLNYKATGVLTFDRLALQNVPLSWSAQLWLFLAFVLAFAVKTPIWPLHTWLPDAYVESPAPVTILLAGVLSKMGIYGLIRLCLPLFPSAVEAARPWIWSLAIIGIVYSALIALVQRDMKRLVAFSSMAHVGLIFAGALAANTQGVQGALVQSVSHGLTVSALFLLVSWLEARRGTRQVDDMGGLWKSIPLFGTLMLTVMLASIGLPGLSGFPGEFAMLVGIFRQSPAAAVCAALGMILGAWYVLNLFRKAFAGPLSHPENRTLPDLRRREALVMGPLVVLLFVIGILPNLIFRPTDASVSHLLDQAEARRVVNLQETGK